MIKRNLFLISLLLFIVSLCITIDINVIYALSTIVSGDYRTADTHQRAIVYSQGLWWVFYYDNTNEIYYKTSSDGVTWSSPTTIYSSYGENIQGISVWLNDTYLNIVMGYTTQYGGQYVKYRKGKLNSDGTITWSADWQYVASYYAYPYGSIAVDSNGYPWIVIKKYTGGDYRADVYKSSTKNGTWTTEFSNSFGDDIDKACILPLTNGKMYLIYGDTEHELVGRLYDGSEWGSEETITTCFEYDFSAVANGDTVHLIYQYYAYEDDHIKYLNWTESSGWSSQVNVLDGNPDITLTKIEGNKLLMFWKSGKNIKYKVYDGEGNWGDEYTLKYDSSLNFLCNAIYEKTNGRIGVMWRTADDKLKFEYICSPNKPVTPLVEGLTNPSGVRLDPHFEANYTNPKGGKLSAYQIQVDDNSDFSSPIWDSGKKASVKNTLNEKFIVPIKYGGSSLNAGTKYYWRIRYWSKDSNNETYPSEWSDTYWFITSSNPTVTNLRAEGTTNPRTSDTTPELKAQYNDADDGNQVNESTHLLYAYEIYVDDNSDFSSPVWSSGKTYIWKNAGNVLTPSSAPAWDSGKLRQVDVWEDSNGVLHMWYGGWNSSYGYWEIGYANSTDGGTTWTKSPLNPVIKIGDPGDFDDAQVRDPSVWDNGTHIFIYTQCFNSTTWPNYGSIGLYVIDKNDDFGDPDNYIDMGQVIAPDYDNPNSHKGLWCVSPCVYDEGNGTVFMFVEQKGKTSKSDAYNVGLYKSSDGISWTYLGPIKDMNGYQFNVTGAASEAGWQVMTSVIKKNGVYYGLMHYSLGEWMGNMTWIYSALVKSTDLTHWEVVTYVLPLRYVSNDGRVLYYESPVWFEHSNGTLYIYAQEVDGGNIVQFRIEDDFPFTQSGDFSPEVSVGTTLSYAKKYYYKIKFYDTFNLSSWSSPDWFIVDRIQVSYYQVDDDRVNIGTDVNIKAKLEYEYDLADVTTGSFTINGITASYVGNGKWQITDSSSTVTSKTYNNVQGNDGSLVNVVNQNGKSTTVIWDRFEFVLVSANDTRINVGENFELRYRIRYDYDDVIFDSSKGSVSGFTWDSANQWWEKVVTGSSSVTSTNYDETYIDITDSTYGITAKQDVAGVNVITDQISVYYEAINDSRVNVNDPIEFRVKAKLKYDNHELGAGDTVNANFGALSYDTSNGWFDGSYSKSEVGDYTFTISSITESSYGITSFTIDTSNPVGIWDRVHLTSTTVSDSRTNINTNVNIDWTLKYDYDETPVTDGSVTIEGHTATHLGSGVWRITDSSSTVTKKTYDEFTVSGNTYGITAVSTEGLSSSVIWDRIQVSFNVNTTLLKVNETAGFTVTLTREYDGSSVTDYSYNINKDGTGFNNPHTTSTFTDTSSERATHTYDFVSVTDNTYGITAFTDPPDITVKWYKTYSRSQTAVIYIQKVFKKLLITYKKLNAQVNILYSVVKLGNIFRRPELVMIVSDAQDETLSAKRSQDVGISIGGIAQRTYLNMLREISVLIDVGDALMKGKVKYTKLFIDVIGIADKLERALNLQKTFIGEDIILTGITGKRSHLHIKVSEKLWNASSENWLMDADENGNNDPWKKRITMTIDSSLIDEELKNFPILIVISSHSGVNDDDITAIFDEVGNNYNAIAFSDEYGTKRYYYDIEYWNATEKEAWIWVKVDSISNITDTIIRIYYDSSKNGSDYHNPSKVWENYLMVQHLEEKSGTIYDETKNDIDSEFINVYKQDATGRINGAIEFDGTPDYISFGDKVNLGLNNFTITLWAKTDADRSGSDFYLINKGNTTVCYAILFSDESVKAFVVGDGQSRSVICNNQDYTDGAWHHIVFRRDGETIKLTVDATDEDTDTGGNLNVTNDRNLYFGRNEAGNYLNGLLDEVKIYNGYLSDAWIKASYYNEKDALIDYNSEETYVYGITSISFVKHLHKGINQILNLKTKTIKSIPHYMYINDIIKTGYKLATSLSKYVPPTAGGGGGAGEVVTIEEEEELKPRTPEQIEEMEKEKSTAQKIVERNALIIASLLGLSIITGLISDIKSQEKINEKLKKVGRTKTKVWKK